MFLRTLTLVFMFLVRLRFPNMLLLLQVICNEYGDTIVKLVRKFEKINFKHRKAALDLNFYKFTAVLMLPRNFCNFVLLTSLRRSQAYQNI